MSPISLDLEDRIIDALQDIAETTRETVVVLIKNGVVIVQPDEELIEKEVL